MREVLIERDLRPAAILDDIRELAAGRRVPLREVGRGRLVSEAVTEAPQGVLARAGSLPIADLDATFSGDGSRVPFLLALDGVTDPRNLGALLRSAECAGATGAVLPRRRSAHITPAVAKAAAGAIEHLPIALTPGLPAALARAADAGVWVVGLDADADRPIGDLPVSTSPVMVVVGAEGAGLSRLVRQRCDLVCAIPLHGNLGSLNVAAAGTVALYEVATRRSPPGSRSTPAQG